MDHFTLAASDEWTLAHQQRSAAEAEVVRLTKALYAAERRLNVFRAIELDRLRDARDACSD